MNISARNSVAAAGGPVARGGGVPLAAAAEQRRRSARPRGARLGRPRRGWLTWLVVAALINAMVWFATTEIKHRLAARERLGLGGVSLTAQPVVIKSIDGGAVLSSAVSAQQHVVRGDLLAVMDPPPGSKAGPGPLSIRSPADGVVLDIAPVGSTLSGGDPIVSLYQPENVYFQAPVSFGTLTKLSIGMKAYLNFPSIGPIPTTLDRVASTLPAESGVAPDRVTLILRPDDPGLLRQVVPGLVLSGWIDIGSAPAGATPALSSFGAGG